MSANNRGSKTAIAASETNTSAAGRQQPVFDVDPSGQASYSIPIEVPPGINGQEPKLNLIYNHRQGNGILGTGWGLSGLSAIMRTKAVYAIDGFNGAVSYDSNDRFALDGQRLINVQGDYGAANSVYYTELQTWRYVKAGASDEDGFTVTQKNGELWTYGGTADSRIMAQGGQEVRVWALSSIEDLNGNIMQFSYTLTPVSGAQASGDYYLDTISYTVRNGGDANRFVRCSYEQRPDPIATYQGGYPITTGYRMTQISTSLADGQAIKTYAFGYRTSTATGISCIESITESGTAESGSPSLPSTKMVWQDVSNPGFDIGAAADLDQHLKPLGVQVIDVNGDGCTDLVQLWQDTDNTIHATVYLATQNGGSTSFERTSDSNLGSFPALYQVITMDVNGDGMTDLVIAWQDSRTSMLNLSVFLSDGQGYTDAGTFNTGDTWDKNHIAFYAADVNGDGRTDLVEAYAYYNPSQGYLLYFRSYLSQFGDGTGSLFTQGIVSPTSDPSDQTTVLGIFPMDVNGDGMMDIVRVWRRTTDSHIFASAYVSVSTSIDNVSFADQVDSDLGTMSTQDQIAFLPADVNGDGMTDLLQVWQEPGNGSTTLHLTSYLCNGAGGFVAGPDTPFVNQSLNQNGFYPMGFNGGAQTNILNKWISGDNKLMFTVYASSPDGSFRMISDFDAGAAGTTVANASFVGGDVNGDGKADLLMITAGTNSQPVVTPFTSSGAYPDLVSSITNPLGGVTTIQYAPISDSSVYTPVAQDYPSAAGLRYPNPLTPAQFPVQSVLGQAIYVVSSYAESNDSSSNRFSYSAGYAMSYTNAQVNMLGRGWEGFETVSKLNLNTGLRIVQTYNQDYPMTGTLAATRIEADGQYATDPRVPKNDDAVLMSNTVYTYQSFVRATGATDSSQQVLEVLKMSSVASQYDYGESNFDFAIGKTYAYDDYGNQTQYTWLGYVNPSNNQPLASDEVVYRYSSYQNDVKTDGWALGYLLYAKTSANATDNDITQFLPGDYKLGKYTYEPGTYNQLSQSQWDNSNNVFLTTSLTYDAYGNQKTKTVPGNYTTTYAYESTYNTYLMQTTFPANAQGAQLSVNYGYDPRFGTLAAQQDQNGFVTISAFDAFGRLAAQQGPVPAGTQSDTNLVTSLVTGSSATQGIFRQAQVVTTSTIQYLSDGSGGNYTQQNSLQSFPTDSSRDFLWKQSYQDGRGRERQSVQQSGQSAGNVVVLTDYNDTGKIVQQSVPFFSTTSVNPQAGVSINYIYDVIDRTISQQQPAGSDGNTPVLTTWYYGSGGQVTQTSASGTDEAYVQVFQHHFYDGNDYVLQSVLSGDDNATTTYSYDPIGRATGMTDPATAANPDGVVNVFTNDSLDRKLSVDNPDQNTTGNANIKAMTYAYDAGTGFLKQQTDAAQQVTSYTFDGLGRVTEKSFTDGRSIQYTYDKASVNGNGKLTQAKVLAAGGALESQQDYAFDSYGNTVSVTMTIEGESSTYTTASVYDPQKRLVQQTFPDGSVQVSTYGYGLLLSQTLGDAKVNYPLDEYTPVGKYGQMVYGQDVLPGNGIVSSYQYNPMGLVYGETVTNNTGNLLQLSYAYDGLNQVLNITDDLDNNNSQSFTYQNKRLMTANTPGFAPGSYDYDASGNIISKNGATYTYNAHFPLSMTDGGNTLYSATQDACGRTQTRTVNGSTMQFTYDSMGNLSGITSGGSTVCAMLSDQDGKRIRETKEDGTVVLYISAAYEVKKKSNGDLETTVYLRDAQGATAAVRTKQSVSTTEYYRRDYKGSITLIFDSGGNISSTIVYDGYGLPLVTGSDDGAPKYEQRYWDDDTSLYYFGARYYDPLTGRFLTPDCSLGSSSYLQPDALNRFAFDLNNPVNNIDPTGHMAKWVAGLLVGLTILVAGIAIVATAGAAAPAIVGLVAGEAVAASTVATATAVVSGALTVIGSAGIAAGMSGTSYALSHRDGSFSWKNFGIQTAISGAVGAVTGGLFIGLSAATAGMSAGWSFAANTLGSGLISSAGDVTAQFFTNLAEGAKGHDLATGLALSAVSGFGFGAAGGALGYGFGKAMDKFVDFKYGSAIKDEAVAINKSEFESFNTLNSKSATYSTFPNSVEENIPIVKAKVLDTVMNKPPVRLIQFGVASLTEFPEAFTENDVDWQG